MYSINCILVSLFFCANALRPIDYTFINKFDESSDVSYRLPNNTKPSSYDINIKTGVDQKQAKFTGLVKIILEVVEANTSTITLHHRQLNIEKVVLKKNYIIDVLLNKWKYDNTTEFLTIPLANEKLIKGSKYVLEIEYSGELRNDKSGFYKSSYINSKGEERWLAITQFETTDARHAFPCYDEPALKATFDIHITMATNNTHRAVSNTNNITTVETIDGFTTTFETTPKMSTYLVAFMVSDFESEVFNTTSVSHRVFARPEYKKQNHTSYALAEGVSILKALKDYLDVPYSLSKIDQAAIPDFRAGAMENWGLVTYREENLLFKEGIHDASRQLKVTDTITHEFAHQWFGNLVSPKWWSYAWLNEGFATLFEAIGINAVHPKWDIWSYFVTSKVHQSLALDAGDISRPMTYYTEKPANIAKLFDGISYGKAGSVIRMFMHVLGEETFKKGLNLYLKKRSNDSADENDLFDALDAAAKGDKTDLGSQSVKTLFSKWSNQIGFPVLSVKRTENGSLELFQEKYDDEVKQNVTSNTTWWIPYNYATASQPIFNETKPMGWLKENEDLIEWKENVSSWTKSDWVLFNRQQTGYYRVWYDDENYKLLSEELNKGDFDKIHPINRAQLLDDLHHFVKTGRVPPKTLCSIMNYLTREVEYAPWVAARKAILDWEQSLQASNKLGTFRSVVAKLVEPYYNNLNLTESQNDEILDKLARKIAVDLACRFGVTKCLDDTYAKFQDLLNGTHISPNIRGVVMANGILKASDSEIATLWQNLLNSKSNNERKEIIQSLGNIPRASILELYLGKSIGTVDNETLSAEERMQIFTTVAKSGQEGVSMSIKLLKSNSTLEKFNSTIGKVADILKIVSEQVLTKEMQSQFADLLKTAQENGFIDENEAKDLTATVNKTIEWQSNNVKSFETGFFADQCAGPNPEVLKGGLSTGWIIGIIVILIVVIILIVVGCKYMKNKNK